ncbi:MAG: glycosyltransferase family 2 protein [Candidatus Taylorbacteria bacterium]|nr:glycosyltransferase family 2 protein [Candidatus Taylorbacteria bacterium]
MNPELTIIIPCYNCEKTLKEAVDSCFEQGLQSFEIVMVDDGSTDGTYALMQSIQKTHPDIVRIFKNDQNLGGGATRNRAVQESKAEAIFCLDSDDILPEGTLSSMFAYMKQGNYDGVGIHKSIKFKGANKSDVIRIDSFGYTDEIIPINALIETKKTALNPLYSTFMHTKNSFLKIGGYTEFHGFDTQSLAWRFLTHGFKASTCKNSSYLHRQQFNKSYYVREYESGKINYNWFDIYDEFLIFFHEDIQKQILSFDFTDRFADITQVVLTHPNPLVQEIIQTPVYTETFLDECLHSENIIYRYWAASELLRKGRVKEALEHLHTIDPVQFPYKALQEKITMCEHILHGMSLREAYREMCKSRTYIKRGSQEFITKRVLRKVKKELKRIPHIAKYTFMAISFFHNIRELLTGSEEYTTYYNQIDDIKRKKKIVLDIAFGGLGDWLAFTGLPRLLHDKYGIEFYISQQSLTRIRNKDIFKLCFEMNPYFKGIVDTDDIFSFKIFARDYTIKNFITDQSGVSVTEILEKQFNVDGKGVPEIYYAPKTLDAYKNIILVDKNYISGIKLGWIYDEKTFDKEIAACTSQGLRVEYVDPKKQDLFTYIDMIYSSHNFITVLSGGAALCACLDKPFVAILPKNIFGGSVNIFTFKKSKARYVR